MYVQRKNGPCPEATRFSLSQILSELPGEPELSGVVTISWKGGATGSLEGGVSGFSVRRGTGQTDGKVRVWPLPTAT